MKPGPSEASLLTLTLTLLACIDWVRGGLPADLPDDWNRTTAEVIRSRGYHCTEHEVETSDGYLLPLFRIVNPVRPAARLTRFRPPVLLLHGLFHSSTQWLVNSDDGYSNERTDVMGNSLAFELSKRGFDVWLGVLRGTLESLRHKTMTYKESKYWKFNFDDYALRDLPAMMHVLLQVSNSTRVDFVGHSIGSAVMFALLSVSGSSTYNALVHRFVAYPPVAFLANQSGLQTKTQGLVAVYDTVDARYPANLMAVRKRMRRQCAGTVGGKQCKRFFSVHDGQDDEQLQDERVVVYILAALSGTSTAMMAQQKQWAAAGTFARYDYGERGNFVAYGQSGPPAYDVTHITHPKIHMMYGEADGISTVDDIFRLINEIPVKTFVYRVNSTKFNHFDFVYGKDAGLMSHLKVLEILTRVEE